MKDLTFVCAYFENAGMLVEQQRTWAAYAPDLKRRFHAIVTDDCSPTSPARDVFAPVGIASQRLFRAGVQRRWDWLFCRNLGIAKATTDWVLFTDIDHVLPASTLRAVLEAEVNPRDVYRFTRVDAPHLTPYKQHPNTWMCTRALFDRIGGYDERFSGFYGSDSEFRERVQRTARAVVTLPVPLIRYPREVIPDASTTTYERKVKGLDDFNVQRIKAAREEEMRKTRKPWAPLRLTIPYTLEASC